MASCRSVIRGLVGTVASAVLGCASQAPSTTPAEVISKWAFLHVIPTHAASGLAFDQGIRVALYIRAPAELARLLVPQAVLQVHEDHLVLRLDRYPGRLDADPAALRAPTFVIDYDSQEVEFWADKIEAEHGPAPRPQALVDAVRDIIHPLGGRGFEFASTIARDRRGDCTEHAVLFAALARRFGYPTRVVFGGVFAEVSGEMRTFGHAWNELYEAQAWGMIDSTPMTGGTPTHYVPYGYLENEGPGYGLSVFGKISLSPVRVDILGNLPAHAGGE